MLPKISIITPSYNQGHFIEETITSVLDQGYPNLEYIIMDGGSKDNTVEVIKKYEKHITYWVSERDKGQSDAINKGFARATGDVINWLNSDDYYAKGTLQRVGEVFSDPNVNVYLGISRIFGNKGEYHSNGTDFYPGNTEKTIGWARIDQPETFFRKSCLDKIGYSDEQFHYVMDRELWIRYLINFGIDNVKKTKDLLVNFRIHDDSKTNSFPEKFHTESLQLFGAIAQKNHSKFENCFLWPKERIKLKYDELYNIGKDRADRISNYKLLYVMLNDYAANDYDRAKKLAKLIDVSLLAPEDAAHFREIMQRMKLPLFVKKLFNKFKS